MRLNSKQTGLLFYFYFLYLQILSGYFHIYSNTKPPNNETQKIYPKLNIACINIGVFGKIKWDGQKYVGTDPTTTDILGPFYRPGAPFKTDLVQARNKRRNNAFQWNRFWKRW